MNGGIELDPQTYEWCVRLFEHAQKLLKVDITFHHQRDQIVEGDVFLFNHFARAESFIPQYLIYRETGTLCRSVAAAELFKGNDRFARMLRDVGAVPNDHPELLKLLAVDILRGRKVVIFPEGGMVKDRQVVDGNGEYGVYSRSANARRKHHSGAARLATGLQIFKQAIARRLARGRMADLERWADELGLPSAEVLVANAARPVTIVPANITFHPLRVSDNFLRRGAELVLKELSPRAAEELVVEGNLFFKATDMDIRLGDPIRPAEIWSWWERALAAWLARDLPGLDAAFRREHLAGSWPRRLANRGLAASVASLRDRYMRDIYRAVTVNVSHLAARAVLEALEAGRGTLPLDTLCRVVYLALKTLQRDAEIHLHRGLGDPERYRRLLNGPPEDLREFLAAAADAGLITLTEGTLELREKLRHEHGFDAVRLENPLEVYANEIEPLPAVGAAVRAAWQALPAVRPADWARHAFDDEQRMLSHDRRQFSAAKHHELNASETATADPAPFLFTPEAPRPLGVVLVHGFLATPAEVRPFGEKLAQAGYPVIGVRLKGHGTSPWDLRERSWRDWLASVAAGAEILRPFAERICVVGFSTGGALALAYAAEQPPGLAGVVSICPPLKFRNRNMRFVPLVHGANRFVAWVAQLEGVMPFRPAETEHPLINYQHMPVRGLYELTRMVGHLRKTLPAIRCPVSIVQSSGDPVVDPAGAEEVRAALTVADKTLHWVEARRHGILYEDIGATHALVMEFLARRAAALSP
ncbi:MAG: alpha/beta fold hydrolase [Gammaproteobacteria bacterium]|nr:alpha/beta fold hydrolase [Gammaproteobacteria bacterium]